MNNKKLGNNFEREFVELLASKGYWVHFMTPDKNGKQPCDIIACKDGTPFLIDCKTSAKKVFPFSRLEDNQVCAFEKFGSTGNSKRFVAIKFEDKIYFVHYLLLKNLKKVELTDEFLFKE